MEEKKYKPGVEIITDTSTFKPSLWILAETYDGRNLILGGKFAIVIDALSNGYSSFSQLKKHLGMSRRLLENILKMLEDKEIIERQEVSISDMREKPFKLKIKIHKKYSDGNIRFSIVY